MRTKYGVAFDISNGLFKLYDRKSLSPGMTLTQLAYAVAVDEYRHFGRAAEHCHVSQPTLSMQLQKLEEELGIRLFDRSKKPVLPTPEGRRILRQARHILRECQRLQEMIYEDLQAVRGELKVGIIPTLSPYVLPLATPVLRQQYPELHLQVEERTTQQILQALAEDRLDVGLIATEEDLPGLQHHALFEEPFVAYLHPDHPLLTQRRIHPSDLAREDLWLLSEGHCFREQVLQVCNQPTEGGPTPQLRFESGHLETLRLMVDTLGGITLLPFLATHFLPAKARQHLRFFQEPAPTRTVYLVHIRRQLKAPLLEAYMQTLRQAIAPHLPG